MTTTPFDITIYGYLIEEGYTHVHLNGLRPATEDGDQYFYITPLKKEDSRMEDLLWDGLAAALKDDETAVLFEGIGYQNIRIEWEVAEYAAYLLAMAG